MSTVSSCCTIDSDDFDSGSEVFAGQYRAFRNDMDMGDMVFGVSDSENSASFSMARPPSLLISQQFQLSVQNPIAQLDAAQEQQQSSGMLAPPAEITPSVFSPKSCASSEGINQKKHFSHSSFR